MDSWSEMKANLAGLERQGLRRHGVVVDSANDARIRVAGVDMVCLCGNNYLGLANHVKVRAAAAAALADWGVGAGASRLVCGTTLAHIELQDTLADWLGVQAALVTPTGWQANACAIAAMVGEGDLVLCDKLNHASILDAANGSGATLRTYVHGDAERLESLLNRLRPGYKRCLIVTDGLFSMDGDMAPLPELVKMKERYQCMLMVDEAHALAVLGETGRGTAELLGAGEGVDVITGTLSKALGSLGGFVAGREELCEMIFTAGRPFMFTTALPACLCEAALMAMAIAREEPQRRRRCLHYAERLRETLRAAGADIGASQSQIIPIIVGSFDNAMALSKACFDAGFLIPAIRPPTVAPNACRLRVSVMATHEWADLARFADVVGHHLHQNVAT